MTFSELAGSDEGAGWTALVVLFVLWALPLIAMSLATVVAVWTVVAVQRRRNPPPRTARVLRLDLESGTWQERRETRQRSAGT